VEAPRSPLAPAFVASGFSSGASGLSLRRGVAPIDDDAELLEEA
jgi:hypothetical protein